jgi:hypothetical protein
MSSIFSFSKKEKSTAVAVAVVTAPIWVPVAIIAAPFYAVSQGIQHARHHHSEKHSSHPLSISAPKKHESEVWKKLKQPNISLGERCACLFLLGYPHAAADVLRQCLSRGKVEAGVTFCFAGVVFARAGDFKESLMCLQKQIVDEWAERDPFDFKDAGCRVCCVRKQKFF